jgi:hypothetical protein
MINPDAGDLGAKVGFVFAGLSLPLCVAFFFLIPETKGLTFDEVSSSECILPEPSLRIPIATAFRDGSVFFCALGPKLTSDLP